MQSRHGFICIRCNQNIINNFLISMYFDDDESIPTLLPIKKKRHEDVPFNTNSPTYLPNTLDIFPKDKKVTDTKVPQIDPKKAQKQSIPIIGLDKIGEFDKKFKNIHEQGSKKQERDRKMKNEKQKQVQKSKYLITEIMRKIDAKNITEELYPATNETIEELIIRMDDEIDTLKADADRKENSLLSNPLNQHLKKQLEGMKSSIDRCTTIKELYNQKINLRNKISILERNIIGLKEENQNLKIRINRGIETIENHMHNLPCQKEKQLKLELNKCQTELKKQNQMREKLEKNISEIVLNFKRLYTEADTARQIITNKLQEVQEREKKIMDERLAEPVKDITTSEKKSPQQEIMEERRIKKSGSNLEQVPTPEQNSTKKPNQSGHSQSSIIAETIKKKAKEQEQTSTSAFSLEQQIRKMRSNQQSLAKSKYR